MSKKPFGAATIYVILGLLFIAVIGIRTISTPEIWTHLAQGKVNAPISFLESDSVVNTTHLYDKIAYGMWNVGGPSLLIVLNIMAMLAAFILLIQVSKKWGGELSQGFALLLSGHLIFQGLDVGPETTMMLFIALFVYLLSTFNKPAILFGALIPLQILWTNMHGSFLFGPLIAALVAVECMQANKIKSRKKKQSNQTQLLAILAGALLVCTLINPYLLKLHAQVIADVTAPYPVYWSSLFKEYFQTPPYGPLMFLVFILGAGGLVTLKKRLPVLLTTLAIISAFLMIRSVTTAQLFAVLAFPFLVLSLSAVGEYLTGSLKVMLGKQAKLLAPVTQGIFVLLLIISILPVLTNCAYSKLGSASSFGFGADENLYPEGVEAIINHPVFPEVALNLAADGGYLAFKYDRKIFIDYRPGRYSREVIEDLNAMMLGNTPAYDKIYETYRPEAIIINTLNPASAQGIVTLLGRRLWKLAYFDGTTAILILNKEEFEPILNNPEAQAAGLAKLEAARAAYAVAVEGGCRAANPPELIGSGKIFLALNRPIISKAIFSLLLKGNQNIPGAWVGLGNSQLLLKEFDAAVTSLNHATTLTPNSLLAWMSYRNACRYAGNTAEQEKAEKKVQELAAENMAAAEQAKSEAVVEVETQQAETKSLTEMIIPE